MPANPPPDDPVLPSRVQGGQTDRRDGAARQHGAGIQADTALENRMFYAEQVIGRRHNGFSGSTKLHPQQRRGVERQRAEP